MFARPFWPEDFFDVVCTNSFIPEFWVTKPPTFGQYTPASVQQIGQGSGSPQHAQQAQSPSQHDELHDANDSQQAQHAHLSQHAQPTQHAQQQQSQHYPNGQQQQAQQAQHTQQQEPQQQQTDEAPVHCMVGFVAGSRAEDISKLTQNSVIIRTLSQLDQMFGKHRRHELTSA